MGRLRFRQSFRQHVLSTGLACPRRTVVQDCPDGVGLDRGPGLIGDKKGPRILVAEVPLQGSYRLEPGQSPLAAACGFSRDRTSDVVGTAAHVPFAERSSLALGRAGR